MLSGRSDSARAEFRRERVHQSGGPSTELIDDPGREDPGAGLDLGERDLLVGAMGDPDIARPEDDGRRARPR